MVFSSLTTNREDAHLEHARCPLEPVHSCIARRSCNSMSAALQIHDTRALQIHARVTPSQRCNTSRANVGDSTNRRVAARSVDAGESAVLQITRGGGLGGRKPPPRVPRSAPQACGARFEVV